MRLHSLLATVVLAGLALAATSSQARATDFSVPPFTEAPAVGADTSAAVRIVIDSKSGLNFYYDKSQPAYENVEDTLVGVVNKSGATSKGLNLHSTASLFDLDGDGLTVYGVKGNPLDKSGYGGPNVYFTNISSDLTSGTVNFINPLAPGDTTFFALEESPDTIAGGDIGGSGNIGTVSQAPEPGSLILLASGVLGLAGYGIRRRQAV